MTTSDASDQPIVHTPGPWEANCFLVSQAGGRRVEICHTGIIGRNKPGEQAEADARLIAASPDLLEACKMYLDAMDRYGHPDKTDRLMRAAIEKATGEVL
jgi:hypothetical protein